MGGSGVSSLAARRDPSAHTLATYAAGSSDTNTSSSGTSTRRLSPSTSTIVPAALLTIEVVGIVPPVSRPQPDADALVDAVRPASVAADEAAVHPSSMRARPYCRNAVDKKYVRAMVALLTDDLPQVWQVAAWSAAPRVLGGPLRLASVE